MRPGDDHHFEPLGPQHDRTSFQCGVPALDTYFQRQARQDVDRRLASVFVLSLEGKVAGFYTLSATSISAVDLPLQIGRKLPRFPLPVTLLGRMAVSQDFRGRGLGQALLMHALRKSLKGSKEIASWAVIVDAKPDSKAFYLKYEFQPFETNPERLFLPIHRIEGMFTIPL